MTRAPISDSARRLKLADQIIARGGNLASFSKAAGLSPAGGLKWLRAHDPDRLAALVSGRAKNALLPHAVLVRLLWLKATEGMRGHQRRVCRALGVSPQRLAQTRKQWAPDGLDAAIADLMPDGGAGIGKSQANPGFNALFPIGVHEVAHG